MRPSECRASLVSSSTFSLLLLLALPVPSAAQYQVLLDLDGLAATGCTLSTASGNFTGVEQVLLTTVAGDEVTAVSRRECTAGVLGAPQAVTDFAPPWSVGLGVGVFGSDVVETYYPLAQAPYGDPLRIAFVVDTGRSSDALLTLDGSSGGGPILVGQAAAVLEIPTLSWVALLLLVLGLLSAGTWVLRRRRRLVPAAALLLALGLGTGAWAVANIVLDGDPSDWLGASDAMAIDQIGDAPQEVDIYAGFAALSPDAAQLYLRFDVSRDALPPVGVDDAFTVVEDAAATLLAVLVNDTDADGGPKSVASVTQPANGTVVITNGGAGLSYTPTANYCNNPPGTMPDTFTYTLAPGSSTATVRVAVTCIDDAPVAVADTATVAEDSGATAISVLTNDTDIDGGPKSVASVTQPANGAVLITGGGSGLSYAPTADYCNDPPGTTLDTFTYTLSPGGSMAMVSVTVTCVDDNPVAVDDAATVAEDAVATAISVLANDTDVDGGAINITGVTQPVNGTVVITGGGSGLTYAPNADYCNDPPGTTLDTFTYTLSPGGSMATVNVTVTCGDDVPTAVDDAATVAEDAGATAVDVLANDTDVDGGPKSVTSVMQPANGTVVITGGGSGLTYAPNADYCNDPPGTMLDTFTYTLAPGGSVATVSVGVTCVDDDPVAVDDAATVAEDAVATAIDVLANDSDIDGGAISITGVTQPVNGTVVITGGGSGLSYAPNADYCNDPPGTTLDTFTYTLSPGGSMATVNVTVTCGDDVPTAVDDAATVAEDAGATAVDVLANDTDIDGGAKSVTSVTQPTSGTVVITGGGSGLTYAPNADYCNDPPGTTLDTFTYTLTPGGSVATVTMTVTCVDDNPVAVNDAATVAEDTGATAVDVLANDTDVDGGPKSVTSVMQPTNGTVVITGGGSGLTYAPNADYCNDPPGTTLDTFTYTLTPGGSMATVTMTVTCVDDSPVAVNDAATVAEDAGATAVDVLANDTDVDGGPKSVTSVMQPTNGTVVITGGGSGLTYAPNADYCNQPPGTTLDTFTYTLTPGGSVATVTMTVTCVDDNPVAVNDAATVAEDAGATAVDVLANDTDVDGGPKSVTGVMQPTNGTVVITGGGSGLTYAPNADYCNQPPGTMLDTFTYTLTPGGSVATVTVTVTCVDDAPVAVTDATTVLEDSGATAIDVLANDTDVDGGPKSVTGVMQPTNGTVVITGGGSGLTYAPNANYCNDPPGTTLDTFTYSLTPGGSMATVTVTVTCVNDPPVAGSDSFETIGNTELRVDLAAAATPHVLATTGSTFGVLDNDSDPVEGSPVTVVGIVGCADISAPFGDGPTCASANGGSVVLESNGRFRFIPAVGSIAADSFQYQLSDGTDVVNGTVNLPLQQRVWYVDNTAAGGGNGTSAAPFDTLTPLDGAGGAGDPDSTGDTVFVFFGDGTSTGLSGGLELENGQRLLGEHVGLSFAVGLNGNAAPTVLVAAAVGSRPLVEDLGAGASALVISNAIPAEIAGLSLAGTTNGIDWTTTGAFAASGTASVHDNIVRSAGAEGVDFNFGGTGTLTVSFVANGLTATGNAFDARTTAGALRLAFDSNANLTSASAGAVIDGAGGGTLTVTSFSGNSVHGNTAGNGLVVNSAVFDATPGGALDTVNGGVTAVGSGGNPVGLSALSLTAVSGDLAFSDLDLFTSAGTGLRLTGTGAFTGATGTRVTLAAAVGSVSAIGGPAIDLIGATVTLPFVTVASSGSPASGVSLVTVGGTFSAAAGSSISTSAGHAFQIDGGNANVSYAGTIATAAGRAVSVINSTGGTKTFSGAISANAVGIRLDNNAATDVAFTGGLTLSTGANIAFHATNGGTLTVTGAANTLTTTTGIALNLVDTPIAAAGVTFRSINAGTGISGPSSGIVLDNTGTSGGLTVTGTGGAVTGGTIQRASGNGVQLIQTRNVSLSSMVIQDNLGSGIFGDDVTNFSLIGSSVLDNADTTGGTEAGLRFQELLGTCAITNSIVSGSVEDNIRLTPASGVLTNLAISGTTIGPNNAVTGGNGLAVVGIGTADVTINITGSNFPSNRGSAVLTSFTNSARHTVNISTTTFADNNTAIDLGTDLDADLTFTVSSNSSILRSTANAINIITGTGATNNAQLRGTIDGNTIGDGSANSGSANTFGIAVDLRGDVDAVLAITNNTVRNTDFEGIFVQSRLDNDADAEIGLIDLTVRDNTVTTPDDNSGFPAGFVNGTRIESRNTSNVCLDIASNTSAGVGGAEHFRLRQRDTSTFRVERLALGAQTAATTAIFTAGANDAGSTASATAATSFTGVADGTCRTP